ncbi:CPXCG motif-containing cysteine-rich protein [Maribacter sp. 4U21]|uniref:CPXCG motif-containing cysteine-rich protein n=1 Tax=Maribacter sp. 4U21 TaxID=1889779 RepID=UPI000C15FFE0|nr:CPXCG motif-containing cysteine-rich protein [Maribacter sp. 4U21]PIB25736.1 CPXCG motif-containing cysteine-rich protein [Maribacter sp. 4U21]
MLKHFFHCPYCWEKISMLLDTSVINQTYVEDGEIRCNPIEIRARFSDKGLMKFQALDIEQ